MCTCIHPLCYEAPQKFWCNQLPSSHRISEMKSTCVQSKAVTTSSGCDADALRTWPRSPMHAANDGVRLLVMSRHRHPCPNRSVWPQPKCHRIGQYKHSF